MEKDYWRDFGRVAAKLYASALVPAGVLLTAAGALMAPAGGRTAGSVLKVKKYLPGFALFWTVPSIHGSYLVTDFTREMRLNQNSKELEAAQCCVCHPSAASDHPISPDSFLLVILHIYLLCYLLGSKALRYGFGYFTRQFGASCKW